jgi:hypothetical protein
VSLPVDGFTILRSPNGQRADAVPVSALISSEGDGVVGASYHWNDSAPVPSAAYWLAVQTRDGATQEYGPVQTVTPRPSANVFTVFLPIVQ